MEPRDLPDLGDVLLDREVGKEAARLALCSLFSLRPEETAIVESSEELATRTRDALCLCLLVRLAGGDFPTLLRVDANLPSGLPRIPTAARLCRLLGCRCLVSDGSVNPFTFLLVDAGGECRRVAVDVDRMDRDEYVIAATMPME
jgi:hypothetical protein